MKMMILTLVTMMTTAAYAQLSAQTINETDLSRCSTGSPISSLNGHGWVAHFRDGEFTFAVNMIFQNGQLITRNECGLRNHNLSAQIAVPYLDDGSAFTALGAGQKDESINEAGFHMDCSVAVKPMRVNYSFQGACMRMRIPGEQDLTLAPLF